MSFKLDTTRRYVVTNLSFDGKTIQNIAVKEAFAIFIFKVGQFPTLSRQIFIQNQRGRDVFQSCTTKYGNKLVFDLQLLT